MSETATEQSEELTDSDTHADPCQTTRSSSTKPAASNHTNRSRSQSSTVSSNRSAGVADTNGCESMTTSSAAPSAASQRRLITDGGTDSSAESGDETGRPEMNWSALHDRVDHIQEIYENERIPAGKRLDLVQQNVAGAKAMLDAVESSASKAKELVGEPEEADS